MDDMYIKFAAGPGVAGVEMWYGILSTKERDR